LYFPGAREREFPEALSLFVNNVDEIVKQCARMMDCLRKYDSVSKSLYYNKLLLHSSFYTVLFIISTMEINHNQVYFDIIYFRNLNLHKDERISRTRNVKY